MAQDGQPRRFVEHAERFTRKRLLTTHNVRQNSEAGSQNIRPKPEIRRRNKSISVDAVPALLFRLPASDSWLLLFQNRSRYRDCGESLRHVAVKSASLY